VLKHSGAPHPLHFPLAAPEHPDWVKAPAEAAGLIHPDDAKRAVSPMAIRSSSHSARTRAALRSRYGAGGARFVEGEPWEVAGPSKVPECATERQSDTRLLNRIRFGVPDAQDPSLRIGGRKRRRRTAV